MANKSFIHLFRAGIFAAFFTVFSSYSQTFVHEKSNAYIPPKEPEVIEQLEKWKDLKFGMLIHWGLYSQLGIVESWSICNEEWITRKKNSTYDAYKRDYWATIDRFNPVGFDPETWAKTGRNAGLKYVVFTTKHHDGFCMFDTKQTDFSITHGIFGKHPRSNIAKEVFQAFRNENYMIGAYFSKPDWHSQDYWWDYYATPDRNNNYSIDKFPERWANFSKYTYSQIEELLNGDYGKIDILWLDGGWVRPRQRTMGSQDINMPAIAAMARNYQPDLLIVDRTVEGEFENYQTPERGIPQEQLATPWESCIPLGNDWGYVPTDRFKSPARIIHSLAEIVAKGGNFLLGIGPKPDGTLSEEVTTRLEKIGEWVRKNGEAIYETRITPHYHDGNTWFVQSKDGKTVYAIACLEAGKPVPEKLVWQQNIPSKGGKIRLLQNGKTVKWRTTGNSVEITVPKGLPDDLPALAFAIESRSL